MGRPKPWLPYAGGTVLGTLLGTLERSGCWPLVVVVRRGQELPPDALARPALVTAINPEPERGMLSSLCAGLDRLGGAAAVAAAGRPLVICPADHPAVTPATVRRLLRTLAAGAALAVPTWRGRRGHPLAVAAATAPEIPQLDPGIGLRQLLDRHAATLVEVEVDDRGVVADLDTPEDYKQLTAGR